MSEPLRVGELKLSSDHRRVTAMVDGAEVFFETDDVPLVAAPEALAGAMLLPALQTRRQLIVDGPLDAGWLENAEKSSAIFGKWWDYPCQSPIVPNAVTPAGARGPTTSIACFTGGVDSFHLQLKGDHPTDNLLFVHGYDISLDDTARFARFQESFRAVAAQLRKKTVIVRTNLSRHPTFLLVSWERIHVAALAAAAHFLGGVAGTFVIPSSYAPEENINWGSHWETDPLWSSSRVQIISGDVQVSRPKKIAALAEEPLAQQHLRVCFKRPPGKVNCSRCQKCLRTMTMLTAARALHRFPLFEQTVPLAKLVDDIEYMDIKNLRYYAYILELDLPPDVMKAWRGVYQRTYKRYHPSLLRRAVRLVRRWRQGAST